jgi:hypothetical protein
MEEAPNKDGLNRPIQRTTAAARGVAEEQQQAVRDNDCSWKKKRGGQKLPSSNPHRGERRRTTGAVDPQSHILNQFSN